MNKMMQIPHEPLPTGAIDSFMIGARNGEDGSAAQGAYTSAGTT